MLDSNSEFVACYRPGSDDIEIYSSTQPSALSIEIRSFSGDSITLYKGFELNSNAGNSKRKAPYIIPRPEYLSQHDLISTYFERRELDKIILSRVHEGGRIDDPSALLVRLKKLYPDTFVYLSNSRFGTWIGASPELLVSALGNQVSTVSLAGTLPYSEKGDYNWSDKEFEEQQMVTDFIVEKVKSAGEINELNGPVTKRAGGVVHLYSTITGQVDNIDGFLEELHPTPAICGIPRDTAYDLIENIEPHDRGLYTGYIALKEDNNVDAYVNLRCMQIVDGKAFLFVGGGITSASDPVKEWEETVFKAQTLLRAIEIE